MSREDVGGATPKDEHPATLLSARQNARLRENLKRALEAAGQSRRGLAQAAGLSAHAVSDIGRHKNGPRLTTLLAIVQQLELYSIEELLGPSGTAGFLALDATDEVAPSGGSEPS